MTTVHVLILAAGASSRMRGADKLLQPVGPVPMLRHVAQAALSTGAPVTVMLPTGAEARRVALSGLSVEIIEVPDAALGMSRALVRGVRHVASRAGVQDGLMVLPADMPGFTGEALRGMIAVFQEDPTRILRGGGADGRVGHPAVFPRAVWPELLRISGDEGGRSVLAQHADRIRVIPLPGRMATLDLDTPEDWAAWRAGDP